MSHGVALNAFIHLLYNSDSSLTTSSITHRIKHNILSSSCRLSNDNKCASFLLSHHNDMFVDSLSHIVKHNIIASSTTTRTDSKVRLIKKYPNTNAIQAKE